MSTKFVTPARLLQMYQSFRKKLSKKKQSFDFHALPTGGFMVDRGTEDEFFVTNDDYENVFVDKKKFLLRPESVLFLVSMDSTSKNLFCFIIAHLLNDDLEFTLTAKEKQDFKEWCSLVNIKVPADETIKNAVKLLVKTNVAMSVSKSLYMLNPMILVPKEALEDRLFYRYVTSGIQKLVKKNQPIVNFVFEKLFPKTKNSEEPSEPTPNSEAVLKKAS